MSARALIIEVRLIDGRFHGLGDWPPSPFRLFSALVAGAYGGRWASEMRDAKDAAFRWLERLGPPAIAVPHAVRGQATTLYVPNNDLDAVGGDPARISEIRGSTKVFAPRLFDAEAALLYVWPFAAGEAEAGTLGALSERLFAFGRGIDMAFARSEIVDAATAEARLIAHGGSVSRPGGGTDTATRWLGCPMVGSFDSLVERHAAAAARFEARRDGRAERISFRKAPNPRARQIAYDSPATILLYDLRRPDGSFHAVATERALALATAARDLIVTRLTAALPQRSEEILRLVKGIAAGEADKARRLRFLPLPSIGSNHADMQVRRLAVEVPSDCPLRADDIAWALSGADLSRTDPETGEILQAWPTLVRADDRGMLAHYAGPSRRWRSVTPVALPASEASRSARQSGTARATAEADLAGRLAQALRHAGLNPAGATIAIRREPFDGHGTRSERFANDRFPAGRLAHAEITFPAPVSGLLALGDGRFLGLGLMAPVAAPVSIHAFAIESDGLQPADWVPLAAALRRAVMARARDALGLRPEAGLPVFFCGHEPGGDPARSGTHRHLFFAADPGPTARLLVIAPHRITRTGPTGDEPDQLAALDAALVGLSQLVAGRHGVHRLLPLPPPEPGDPLIGPARTWLSATPYRPTRHPKRSADRAAHLTADIRAECARRGLPEPAVEILANAPGSRRGPAVRARLRFAVAVEGPILLGQDSHEGGGLFRAEA